MDRYNADAMAADGNSGAKHLTHAAQKYAAVLRARHALASHSDAEYSVLDSRRSCAIAAVYIRHSHSIVPGGLLVTS